MESMIGLATATRTEAHAMLCRKFREELTDLSRWNECFIASMAAATIEEMEREGFVFETTEGEDNVERD